MFKHLRVVLIPLLNRVIIFRDPCHCKYRVAELFVRFLFIELREHLICPLHRRHTDHAPLAFIVHRVRHEVRHFGVVSPVRRFDLFSVDICHDPRRIGEDRDIAGSAVVLVLDLVVLPLWHFRQRFHALVLIGHLCDVIVTPLDADSSRTRFISAFHDLPHKGRVTDVRSDHDRLALLDVHTLYHHKIRKLVIHFF